MKKEEIIDVIGKALEEVAPGKVDVSQALPLDVSIRSLGIDSVASMEMVGVVEEEVGAAFPDADLQKVNTLGDLVRLVEANV